MGLNRSALGAQRGVVARAAAALVIGVSTIGLATSAVASPAATRADSDSLFDAVSSADSVRRLSVQSEPESLTRVRAKASTTRTGVARTGVTAAQRPAAGSATFAPKAVTQARLTSMVAGARLSGGATLASADGTTQLTMRTDGTLVKTGRSGVIWSYSCPAGSTFQLANDGRVSILTGAGRVCWTQPALGGTGAKLAIASDGRLLRSSSRGTQNITPFGHAVGLPNTAAAQQMVNQVNAERTRRGLRPLSVSIRLASAGHGHNEWMAAINTLTHQAAGERSFSQRITDAGYVWSTSGENVGYFDTTSPGVAAVEVQKLFMASSGHKANILNPKYTAVGIAVHVSGTRTWISQEFGAPMDTATRERWDDPQLNPDWLRALRK